MQGAGCRVQGVGCRVQGVGRRVQGAGCRVQGGVFRVEGVLVAGEDAVVEAPVGKPHHVRPVSHEPLHLPGEGFRGVPAINR